MGKEFKLTDAINYLGKFLKVPKRNELEGKVLINSYVQPSIGDLGASLLDILVRTKKPMKILEIGTSLGYSTKILGNAVKENNGKVISIEIKENLSRIAEKDIKDSGLSDIVEIINCDAMEFVKNTNEKFDMIFQDGDKKIYTEMLYYFEKILIQNGILITDDILFPIMNWQGRGKKLQKWVDEYNEVLSKNKSFKTVWLPIEDGIAISVKITS